MVSSQQYPLPQLKSIDALFKEMDLSPIGQDLVKVAGGHPKTLEVVWKVLVRYQSQNFNDLLDLVLAESRHSVLGLTVARGLVASAICSICVERTQNILTLADGRKYTTDETRAFGFCAYLDVVSEPSRIIPVLTPFQVIRYFMALNTILGKRFGSSFQSRKEHVLFGGLQFEIFHAAFECFYRMLWSDNKTLTRSGTATIRELYERVALFSSKFDDAEISLEDESLFYEAPYVFYEYFVENGNLRGSNCPSCFQ
jgi:hypothetical protein